MNPGDLVQLKCGGPVMVLAEQNGGLVAAWFDVNLHLQQFHFPLDLLQPFAPAERPLSLEEQIAGMSMIDAITYVRDATGKPLSEAKQFVQDARRDSPTPKP